jgi:cytochrome P450 family 6
VTLFAARYKDYNFNVAGMRFGLMQTKVGLISLLSSYEVRVSEKTPIPLVFDSSSFILAALGGMWLTVVKRSDK